MYAHSETQSVVHACITISHAVSQLLTVLRLHTAFDMNVTSHLTCSDHNTVCLATLMQC